MSECNETTITTLKINFASNFNNISYLEGSDKGFCQKNKKTFYKKWKKDFL